ncbi:tRNA-splicing endonuclease subunit Sen34-like [Paramuricea clavata]|uniref:tRNA-splicing endonuclease subunit Sen34 n=1 Tax=Paramuricea clavata TaxID=317549 RepID=A0A6S7G692_PARCT|nr:tRNA-splicing endonuclease subunit Sen34-like [Paramuricea clavata]
MEDNHEECGEKQEKILLFLSNQEIFVWDKEAVMMLRRKCRIVGSLVGSLPSKPRQNLVFSLPLVLLPEEARLLLDKNIARIVESDITRPSQEIVHKFQDERRTSIQEQIERLEELKQQKLADFAEIIEEGRERVDRKRRISSQNSSGKVPRIETEEKQSFMESSSVRWSDDIPKKLSSEDIHRSSESTDSSTQQQLKNMDILSEDANGSAQKQSEDISGSSENTDEINLQDSTLVCVSTKSKLLRTKDVYWNFPETEIEQVRCKVFSDLWQKGYFITNGNKFGGDYLVYPGDPLRFHSHFIVKILPCGERLTGLDLVSVGRLGSTVKKTSVLASVDSSGKVIYTSVQWSGFV